SNGGSRRGRGPDHRPNKEGGPFRTPDGGKSWSQVLFVDEDTGGADLAADPENPDVIYGSVWQVRNYPWLSYFKPTVGPGSGIYKSTDGGRTRASLQGGLPTNVGPIGPPPARGGRGSGPGEGPAAPPPGGDAAPGAR